MSAKIVTYLLITVLLLGGCRSYEEHVSSLEGLSCRAYTDYFRDGLRRSRGLECSYTCPGGETVGPRNFKLDPAHWATEGDLDRRLCGVTPPPGTASSTPAASASLQPSSMEFITPTAQPPLLTGQVTMCDTGGRLITFKMVEPPPDLEAQALTAQIGRQESTCQADPADRSLLTCTIPGWVVFPARVVLSLEGAVVDDFIYTGLGCRELTTPAPTPTP